MGYRRWSRIWSSAVAHRLHIFRMFPSVDLYLWLLLGSRSFMVLAALWLYLIVFPDACQMIIYARCGSQSHPLCQQAGVHGSVTVKVSDDDYDVIFIFFGSCKLCIDSILDEITIYVRCGAPPSNSEHQDYYIYYMSSTGSLYTFILPLAYWCHTTQSRWMKCIAV